MKTIKRIVSFLLCAAVICALNVPTAQAANVPKPEKALVFLNSSYIRFRRNVTDVSTEFYVKIERGEEIERLSPDDLQVFTDKRVEIFFSEKVWDWMTVHFHGLILSNGTECDCSISGEDFYSKDGSGAFTLVWLPWEADALTVYTMGGMGEAEAMNTSVGSTWTLNFTPDTKLDGYLLHHAQIVADGVSLERNGNRYTFTSTGDGTVFIQIAGYDCFSMAVHVREKSEIKRSMLQPAFENGILWGMAFGYWAGPLVLVVGVPIGFMMGVVKVVRILLA